MFVLGKFARRFPEVVRAIDARGHEVACHGSDHMEIFHQSRPEFTGDVKTAKSVVEETIGRPVMGCRAPDFSIVQETLWALEVLAELGFAYDSSIYPIKGGGDTGYRPGPPLPPKWPCRGVKASWSFRSRR